MSNDAGKRRAAEEAIKYVERGMTLGLGTGSTAAHFVDLLKPLVDQGYQLKGVPTSNATHQQAQNIGVEIITPDETTKIHVAIDGTDEADPNLNLIKGGGGALLREKIVAGSAEKFIVIADSSKRVATLGAFDLPIEIEPFGWGLTVSKIRAALSKNGFDSPKLELRAAHDGFFTSDGNHLILDCALGRIENPADLDSALQSIPGVIDTGLFCGIADMVIYGDGADISIDRA